MKHTAPVPLSGNVEQRLQAFVGLLLDWNRRINLIGVADEAQIWHRHVLDSAQLASLIPSDVENIIDLGSGSGFPGLIISIVTGCHVHLVESDLRKCSFLRHAARITHVNATIHAMRAEHAPLLPAAVVTARALAPLSKLLSLAEPLLTPDGLCLFPKGRSVQQELTQASQQWHMNVEQFSSSTEPDGVILRIREIRRVQPTG